MNLIQHNTRANLILNLNIEVSGWIIDAPIQPLVNYKVDTIAL